MNNVIGPINHSDWLDLLNSRAGVKHALSLPERYEEIRDEWKTYYKSLKDKYCA